MSDTKTSYIGHIRLVLMLLYMTHQLIPFMFYRFPAVLFALVVFLLLLGIGQKIGRTIFAIFPIFVIEIAHIIIDIIVSDTFSVVSAMNIYVLFQNMVWAMMGIYIVRFNDTKTARILFIYYFIIIFINSITTYWGNLEYPNASRILAMGDAKDNPLFYAFHDANIGGFSFIYQIVLFEILIIQLIKYRNRLCFPQGSLYVFIVLLIAMACTVFVAEYTTALLMFLGAIGLYFVPKTTKIVHLLIFGCIVFVFYETLKLPMADFFSYLGNNIDSEIMSDRFLDMSASMKGQAVEDESDLELRKEAFSKSLNSFSNFIFGNWGTSREHIGWHSYIFDNMAYGGIFSIPFFVIVLSTIYKTYIQPFKGITDVIYVEFSLLFAIIMAIVNPMFYVSFLCFVVPIFLVLLTYNTKNKHESTLDN